MLLAQSREKHAGKDAVHCKDGCSAVQGRMQCTAGAVAVHCGSGCSALRLRWPQKVPKSKSLFWISPQKQYWTCARTLYICTTIGGEFTPEKLLRTSSVSILKKCEEEREKPQTWGESVKGRLLPPVRRDRATAVHPIAYS